MKLRLVLQRAAASALAAAALAAPALGATSKHAYVAAGISGYASFGAATSTAAFPIVDGRIASVPDRVYGAQDSGPMAIDGDGTLFAATSCAVDVYAPGSTRLVRSVQLSAPTCGPFSGFAQITALALDRKGHFFVSVVPECCASARTKAPPGAQNAPCIALTEPCTLVYDADARGNAPPLQIIDEGTANSGLATDAHGSLYMNESFGEIEVVADPVTAPRHVRTIQPLGIEGAGNPLIDDGQLYTEADKCSRSACVPGVAVFPQGANGTVAPSRFFFMPAYRNGWRAIATSGEALYALADGPLVDAFDKHATGATQPILSVPLGPQPAFPAYLVVGP